MYLDQASSEKIGPELYGVVEWVEPMNETLQA